MDGGELGALIRARDWSSTSLGPLETWPQSVRNAVSLCLSSRFPILLWLGPELRLLYNDAYIPFLGKAKHPAMLGAPGREAWGEIWDTISPMLDQALAGQPTWVEDFQFFFARQLPHEEVYVTFSYGPIFGDDGQAIEGIFCVCTETTGRIIGERRLSILRDLGGRRSQKLEADAVCRHAAEVLAANPLDIAFAAIYLAEEEGRTLRRVAEARLPPEGMSAFPVTQALSMAKLPGPWPFAEAGRTGSTVDVTDLPNRIGRFASPLWQDPVQTALVLPLLMPGQREAAGFLVAGVSPRRVLSAEYRSFLELVAEHIGAAVAEARAFEDERRRAEALAELDRAKTTFFSNISHEFRTPLTLTLGPLEELLAAPPDALLQEGRTLVTVAHRNALRLLRLVNTLLDFSRIEAGRITAHYEPIDLAGFTADLASNFRSACERAGLRLDIDCPMLPEPVYLDQDMWEKVVLNLLSNALKFTLEGSITVRVSVAPEGAVLRVADTGVGVSAAELPRIFERFHRINGQRSRSHEGSGIGLALVHELVRLHGGRITVESEEGRGTVVLVTLPFGSAHLPPEQVCVPSARSAGLPPAVAYVDEALRWLPGVGEAQETWPRQEEAAAETGTARARLLLADDNADMRDYLVRLLSGHGWQIEAVPDGLAALAAARRSKPDLVLSDVMMPGLGGHELAAALRREPRLADIPVILLSARAGEEARITGLESGADDYLVKPFAARELVARVNTHLALTQLRRGAAERVWQSEARLQAAINLVGLCLYSWDPATDALEWDDRLKALWGLSPGAHVDVGVFLSSVHPDDRKRVEAAIAACSDPTGNGVYHLEYRVIGIEDGVERWVATHGQVEFEKGQPVRFMGAALDITGRKHAEERMRSSEERFRQFAEHSTDVLWILDAEAMQIKYLSPAFQAIWGESPEAVLQDPVRWTESIHPEDRDAALDAQKRALGGEIVVQEYRILRPDGALRWIRDTFFPIYNEAGRAWRVGGIAKDITKHSSAQIYVVDGEDVSRRSLMLLMQQAGYEVKAFASARSFLDVAPVLVPGCVVLDMRAPEVGGLTVPRELKARGIGLPVIVLGGEQGDVQMAVQAMKAGAQDWLEGQWEPQALLAAVTAALTHLQATTRTGHATELARARIAAMSAREREVLTGLMAGDTNKVIARRLGISPRTVEIHRAHVMEQLGVRTLPEAVLLAAAAGLTV